MSSKGKARAAAQQQLARTNQRLTVAAATASIAHDLNQPLAAIVTSANAGLRWLDRSPPDIDEVRSLLQTIVRNGHRASEAIANIRSTLKNKFDEKLALDVNDLLNEVLALAEGELETHQISLRRELQDLLPEVMGEDTQLRQALYNLIMNAVEAMSMVTDRSRVLTVRSTVNGPTAVLITLQDSGNGIDPRHMDRVFEPFFTTKADSLGMGLSLCRSIVEAHGGRVWASARDTSGAVFHIELPVIGPEPAAVD